MDNNNDEQDNSCNNRCCSVSSFLTLLIFTLLFLTFYGIIHGMYFYVIWEYGGDGAISGVYIILIIDFWCSILGILACTLGDGTKFVLIGIYVILGLNCIVNAFVGIFLTTGIKKFPKSVLKSRLSPTADCTDNTNNDSCTSLGIVQICLYVMYLQLLVRIIVLIAARNAFFIEPEPQRRRYGSYWSEILSRLRRSGQAPVPTPTDNNNGAVQAGQVESNKIIQQS